MDFKCFYLFANDLSIDKPGNMGGKSRREVWND
jgi:hypothetical protein